MYFLFYDFDDIRWSHEIWIPKILNFGFLENKKCFWKEVKKFFLISQMLSVRLKKQTSKNAAVSTISFQSVSHDLFLVLRRISSVFATFTAIFFAFAFIWWEYIPGVKLYIRDNFRVKLRLAFVRCHRWFIFIKNLFYQK